MTQKKDPTLAAVLSIIIVGSGQLYVGNIPKGIGLFIGACILGVIFFPLALIPAVYAAYDAYETAKKINVNSDVNVATEAAKFTNPTDFSENLKKIGALLKAEIINNEEYLNKKKEIISELSFKRPLGDPLDFLSSLVPLKQSGLLTETDIALIKTFL